MLLFLIFSAIGTRADDSDALRGLLPIVRLYCAPCFDRYAQELRPRTVDWAVFDHAEEIIANSRRWERRAEGALAIPALPSTPGEVLLRIDGAVFDPAYVYVRIDERWTNLAWALDLPNDQALPHLEDYISVQRAPPEAEPGPDDAF